MQQIRKARLREAAEHHEQVLQTRDQVDAGKLEHNLQWLKEQDRKEDSRRRQKQALADQEQDKLEAHNARIAENLERANRDKSREEFRQQAKDQGYQADDKKYCLEKAAYQKLIRDKLAMQHKRRAGKRPEETIAEMEAHREPGPLSVDNRFFALGEKYMGSSKLDAPAFTFGSQAEHARPRVIDKNLVVDLYNRGSPGPTTSTQDIAASLDKLNLHTKGPSWTFGLKTVEPVDKEQLAKPGPGGTHVTEKAITLTHYASAPKFSFASSSYLARQTLNDGSDDNPIPQRKLLSASHSGRFPSPADYDIHPSLPHFADSTAPRPTFGKADRFLPVDTSAKVAKDAGPQTYTKANKGPGPQRYRPQTTTLSRPLSLGVL